MSTRPWIVDDDLWELIEPLLPPWPERSPGPKPVDDRLCLQGILYVLHQDIAWQLLPLELGFGSGQTCWRCLDRWQQAGVFDQLHRILLEKLNPVGELDWSRKIRPCLGGVSCEWCTGAAVPARCQFTCCHWSSAGVCRTAPCTPPPLNGGRAPLLRVRLTWWARPVPGP
ncbi:transposase [Streptomyces sp. NPDC051453]|uniref:transposase n=1 Tax=Streptomyces sp. NPDC051453 TaxID=3154941 RepID=UPI00341ACA4A